MLHLHDGSRTAPDEPECTSEPQRQSSSHRQQRGSKRHFHNHAPSTRVLAVDHPPHHRTLTAAMSRPL